MPETIGMEVPVGNSKASRERYNKKRKLKRQALRENGFIVTHPASPEVPLDVLLQRRFEDFDRREAYEESRHALIARIPDAGPFGILLMGDPHLDDDGTNLRWVDRDIRLVQGTKALYAATPGDFCNNWVGRLARLYGQQGTTAKQGWQLTEWFVKGLGDKILFLIGGNHDGFVGDADPLRWIAEQAHALYEPDEILLDLRCPNGRSLSVNARHEFKGNSMWNSIHALVRDIQMGRRSDIVMSGHKHTSGYFPLRAPDSPRILHCIQLATYKVYDNYGRSGGFRNWFMSPSVVVVIDPDAQRETQLIKVFLDSVDGAEYLKLLRDARGWR